MRFVAHLPLLVGAVLGFVGAFLEGLTPFGQPLSGRSAIAAEANATGWATLKGRFVYQAEPPASQFLATGGKDGAVCDQHPIPDESLVVDPQSKGIKNVVVFARKVSRVHESYQADETQDVVFDQKQCVFLSHVLPLRTSQTLLIKNSDPVGHNSNISPPGDSGINPLLPAGGQTRHKFRRPQATPVAVTCNIHPWMKAYVLPRNDPYFAVTAADGTFEIVNLPAGEEIEFQVWHETGKGSQGALEAKKPWAKGRFKLKLTAGETHDLGVVEVPASAFK
jgi:hypothetical protein